MVIYYLNNKDMENKHMKTIYLLNEQYQYIPFEYEKLSDIKNEFKKRKIYIGYNTSIGDGVSIRDNASIGNNASIGDDVSIGNKW